MSNICLIERPMTDAEFARMNVGFNQHTIKHGNPVESEERHGFVAVDGDRFVGCSSALVYRHDLGISNWAYLSDLFVEEGYRRAGLGARLLRSLEQRICELHIKYIYTWTAGYEAPGFYKRQGYTVFAELADWYPSGHARIGLAKIL